MNSQIHTTDREALPVLYEKKYFPKFMTQAILLIPLTYTDEINVHVYNTVHD